MTQESPDGAAFVRSELLTRREAVILSRRLRADPRHMEMHG